VSQPRVLHYSIPQRRLTSSEIDNEYNSMDQTLVLNLNQAAINGIRGAGATSQYIFAEGNQWTGAWDWVSVNGGNMAQLTDPQNKLVYEMHQYLDSDYSGTSSTCQSTTIGADSLVGATGWLRSNGKLGFLGEYAGGVNSQCETAVTNMLNYMEQNSDIWLGATWWAAGPWWGTYLYSLEPNSGVAYGPYMPILTQCPASLRQAVAQPLLLPPVPPRLLTLPPLLILLLPPLQRPPAAAAAAAQLPTGDSAAVSDGAVRPPVPALTPAKYRTLTTLSVCK
jgi:hypothetical protein